jgi:hypothetical protein
MYFAWNLTNEQDDFLLIAKELEQNRLRQGWGKNGMDIRLPLKNFQTIFTMANWGNSKKAEGIYNRLRKMLEIQVGDTIIVKGYIKGKDYYVPCGFSIVECTKTYDFVPLINGNYDCFGHFIEVKYIDSYEYFTTNTKLGNSLWGYRDSIKRINDKNILNFLGLLKANGNFAKELISWL